MRYIIFNKPYGVLCQFTDASGRPTLKDYIDIPGIYSVGRLDMDSEGLLLLTDDGKLNKDMADPSSKVYKTYLVQVEGIPEEEQIRRLACGVRLQGKKTLPAKVKLLTKEPQLWPRPKPIRFRKNVPTSWLEIKIREGRNRQVKKMTAAVGLPCLRLVRTDIGNINLDGLQPGEYKEIKKPS
jgi:23S rRNA pseudouridine2457 synthase